MSARLSASGSAKRSTSAQSKRARSPKTVSKITLLRAFDSGDFSQFFRYWPTVIADHRDDLSVRHLDFYIRVYFATQKFRDPAPKAKSEPFNKPMEHLKAYLESSAGVELGKSAELTPYVALPYVKNIEKHPLFKDLKDQKWVSLIRRKLIDFIDMKFGLGGDLGAGNGVHADTTTADDFPMESVEKLRERLAQAERKQLYYKNRCAQLQVNYHRLILVASELVDALEQTVQGTLVTPEQMQDLRSRMFDTRTSGAASSVRTLSTEDEEKDDRAGATKEAPDDPEPSQRAPQPSDLQPAFVNESHNLASFDIGIVDFVKVRLQLAKAEPAKDTALLLQALRWCLTKTEPFESRAAIMASMAQENVLNFGQSEDETVIQRMINSDSLGLQEAFCRLVNTFSCFRSGRSYLLSERQFLPLMVSAVQTGRFSNAALCHTLVTLQKCTVRRPVQIRLIRLNFLKWLIDYLRTNSRNLSSYALEYGSALLMNLSLTTSGKKAAAEDPELILHLMCDLMEHEDAYVISPYVNGTLFSILSLANVRYKAKKMGLHGILDKAIQRPKTASDVRQIPYIIKQLNGELIDKQPPPSDDEYSSSVDDNENGNDSEDETVLGSLSNETQLSDLLEPELDDGDTLAPDPEHPLAGFELLMANYCKPTSESMSQKADNEKRLARVSDEQTVADTVPERPQRVPERRAAQAKGKGKAAPRRLAISSRGYSEKTSNGAALRQTVARVTEDNDVGSRNSEAARPSTLSSSTYLVRSAGSLGRSQRSQGRNSIISLPDVSRRLSMARSSDNHLHSSMNGALRAGGSTHDSELLAKKSNKAQKFRQSQENIAHNDGSSVLSAGDSFPDLRTDDRRESTEPRFSRSRTPQRTSSIRSTMSKRTDKIEYT